MGLLVDGVWHDKWYDTGKIGGTFRRADAQFRNWITADGAAGPTGQDAFKAEPGTLSSLCQPGLPLGTSNPDLSRPQRADRYDRRRDLVPFYSAIDNRLFGARFAHQIYTRADPKFSGEVTVPIL